MKKFFMASLGMALLLAAGCTKDGGASVGPSVVEVNGEARNFKTGHLEEVLTDETITSLVWKGGKIDAADIAAIRSHCRTTLEVLDINKLRFAPGDEQFETLLDGSGKYGKITESNKVPDKIFSDFKALREVKLPPLQSVGAWAFRNCDKIETIDIPRGVIEIEKYAFISGRNLKKLILPEGLTTMGLQAFSGSSYASTPYQLEEIELPSTLLGMRDDTFLPYPVAGNLKTVTCKAKTPPRVEQGSTLNTLGNVFGPVKDGLKIYVPGSSVEAYKSAPRWSGHADCIFPLE